MATKSLECQVVFKVSDHSCYSDSVKYITTNALNDNIFRFTILIIVLFKIASSLGDKPCNKADHKYE